MKYTVISAHCTGQHWSEEIQNDINAAVVLANGQFVALANSIWVFRTTAGYAGHTFLSDAFRLHQKTFVQFSFDFPPCFGLPPEKLKEFQNFLNG